jgi:hypothetical protein
MVTAAILKAAHQPLDHHPRIFDDPIAVGLIPEASEQSIMNASIPATRRVNGCRPGPIANRKSASIPDSTHNHDRALSCGRDWGCYRENSYGSNDALAWSTHYHQNVPGADGRSVLVELPTRDQTAILLSFVFLTPSTDDIDHRLWAPRITRRIVAPHKQHQPSAPSRAAADATAPNCPPCLAVIDLIIAWLRASSAAEQSSSIRHS